MTAAPLLDTVRVQLFIVVIGDVMDAAGLTRQYLPPHLSPVWESELWRPARANRDRISSSAVSAQRSLRTTGPQQSP